MQVAIILPKTLIFNFSYDKSILQNKSTLAQPKLNKGAEATKFPSVKGQESYDTRKKDLVANSEEAAEAKPNSVEVAQARAALGASLEEDADMPAQVDPSDRTECHDRIFPLLFWVFLPVSQKLLHSGWTETFRFHIGNGILRGDVMTEMIHLGFHFLGARQLVTEFLV
ncbi:MAG: hypothetical protein ACHQHP_05270, partial [Bacteroidia bacterium]